MDVTKNTLYGYLSKRGYPESSELTHTTINGAGLMTNLSRYIRQIEIHGFTRSEATFGASICLGVTKNTLYSYLSKRGCPDHIERLCGLLIQRLKE
jgi:hypothetical protein